MSSVAVPREAQNDPPGERSGRYLLRLPSAQLYEMLPLARRKATFDLVDRLLQPAASASGEDLAAPRAGIVEDICLRLNAMGIPLDRYMSTTTVLMPEHDAIGRRWVKGEGVTENVYVRPPGEDPDYAHSPLAEAATTRQWVELWLPDTPDDRFGIVPDLKAGGYVHYLCCPFGLHNGGIGWITLATKSETGFSAEDLATLGILVPLLARTIDARVGWMTLDRLLRIYVGDEPHRAILDGNVKRGQVSTIRSAILFADMRDSTGHTAEISAVQAVELFNLVFDRLVPPIESRRGEILKYLGDGLLAIFRESKGCGNDAVEQALQSAFEMQTNLAAMNAGRPGMRPVELGIALHFGEAAYGNVGSGLRLDFTVIGRDISLASRIGTINSRLAEPVLMSSAFVERLRRPVVPLGAFAARGFAEPIAVFKPT